MLLRQHFRWDFVNFIIFSEENVESKMAVRASVLYFAKCNLFELERVRFEYILS